MTDLPLKIRMELNDKEIHEKLACYGAAKLTDLELLSLVLKDSSVVSSASQAAANVMQEIGNDLSVLSTLPLSKLRLIRNLGMRRAIALSAAVELGKRIQRSDAGKPAVINSDDDAVRILQPFIGSLPHEEFWVLYLTTGNQVLDRVRVSQGGVNTTVVDHRLIVKRAVELLSPSIILAHNHPSGIAEPSSEDIELTIKITHAASLFDITVLDHLIITSQGNYSFRRHGRIR